MAEDAVMNLDNPELESLKDENQQLRRDIDYLAAERANEKKRAERLEEQMQTMRELYEHEANTADDLAHEVARLNKVIKGKNGK
jgi:predicted  nucleic acid-binding Zn-ribbon protein